MNNDPRPPFTQHNMDDKRHPDEDASARGELCSTPSESTITNLNIAGQETKHVLYIRAFVVFVLLTSSVVISLLMYRYSVNVEEEKFEAYFHDMANKLTSEFLSGSNRRIAAIEGFSEDITSVAIIKNGNSTTTTWPNVVVPDFERLATRTMFLSDVLCITMFPIVQVEERSSWEQFTADNQGWFQEGLDFQGIPEEEYNQEWIEAVGDISGYSVDGRFPEHIFAISANGPMPETGPGPYAPWWQFAPVIPNAGAINYNAFSYELRRDAIHHVYDHKQSIVTQTWDYGDNEMAYGGVAMTNLFLQHGGNDKQYEPGPGADVYVPVFETFDSDKVVAELTAYIYWQSYFEDILPMSDVGVYVVLENDCEQAFTYRIDGSRATYLGKGDLHQEQYDDQVVYSHYSSFSRSNGTASGAGGCVYRIAVYPSEQVEDRYLSKDPILFAAILASTVVFTSIVFFVYDYLVERRQRVVMNTAVKTSTVVAALFPEEVRDRLYDKEIDKDKTENKWNPTQYLSSKVNSSTQDVEESAAIADLHPNCTVFFCDLVGFTHWSSSREPRDVFMLLETLYKTFDKAAKQLSVFKVETVGDCYIAATGLPQAQPNHAVKMARFASECLLNTGTVTRRLAGTLGSDTANLTVRIGMHSGPVTAGVLRGAKARFQLFGDTVDTAARMESTGLPSRIQASHSTAELLRAAGHEVWLKEREDPKGSLHTFWVDPNIIATSSSLGLKVSSSNSD